MYKDLSYKIIGCLYEVHKELGSIHKENIYHRALSIEFSDKNISFIEEKPINIKYKDKKVGVYRPDFIIDNKIILEIKAVPIITKAIRNQVYYYIKGTKYKLALLANFGVNKVNVKRFIYT